MAKEIGLDEMIANVSLQQAVKQPTQQIASEPAAQVFTGVPADVAATKPVKRELTMADLGERFPNKEVEDKAPEVVANGLTSMLETIDRKKAAINNAIEEFAEAVEEQRLEEAEQVEEPVAERVQTPVQNTAVKEEDPEDIDVDEEDEGSLEDMLNDLDDITGDDEDSLTVTEEDEETPEEARARYKETLKEFKISPKSVDFSAFKVRKEPVSISSVLASAPVDVKTADWILPATGVSFKTAACTGIELDKLRKSIAQANNINGVIATFKFMYAHIVDDNKPDFEKWCKMVRTEDVDSLYFGLYKACYGDINIVPVECKKKEDGGCEKLSFQNLDVTSMVKYKDDEAKEKCDNIFYKDTTTEDAPFESEIIMISDNFAVEYTKPTLYSTFIQFASLKPEFARKYSDHLDTMAYIKGFYKVDSDNMELIPIQIKQYPDSITKSVNAKLKVYLQVLGTLSADEYTALTTKLASLVEEPMVTYVIPSTTCTECQAEIPEQPIDSMLQMVFQRAQLAQLTN